VQSAITILVAVGEFFAILIAGIDLSVGSILALTGMITGKLVVGGVHPFFAVLIGGIFVGVVLGAINGLLVNFTGLASVQYHSRNQCDISRCDPDHFRSEPGLWLPV
jgi:D-allose transport system permease protein